MYSYGRTAAGPLPEGSKAFLSGHAALSKVGFSVEVTILRWFDKPKGLRRVMQEVEVRLPDGERVTVVAGDLSKA